ncbi:hypothetical protein F9278_18050 [Streptomyces phaeolivaceus]|uniref:Uncharacterized protein n=1 Tax=Streptomyces phaeolivaceus TaxID=2653200 RepID=A0A5P8K3U4_9ACTN|nr:hypothetical protein [Streptomyces phaeolivaceus]QFQ97811.1 hypothetical protein F9278_18050 [Streptomyces phaeolivaceus]
MGVYEDIGTRLNYAEENIATIKAELVTVAHSTNITKPEINGIVGEFVGANFGFKIFNMEKTLFDYQEIQDRKVGLLSTQLKDRIDKLLGDWPADSGGIIADHDKRIKKAQETADRADRSATEGKRIAAGADRKINSMVSGVQREGQARPRPVREVRELRDAATVLNQLEHRVNRLVAALS